MPKLVVVRGGVGKLVVALGLFVCRRVIGR